MKLLISKLIKKADENSLPLQLSPLEINKVVRNPSVQQYFKTLEDRKHTRDTAKSIKLPATALGLGAAGYGMKRLGDAALTPEDRNALDSFASLSDKVKSTLNPLTTKEVLHHPLDAAFHGINPNSIKDVDTQPAYNNSSDLFWEYNDKASRAVQSKLYGKSGLPVIHKVKDLLGLTDAPVTPDSPAMDIEGENHYPAFQKGPFAAYVHQMGKEFTDQPIYSQPDVFFKYPNSADKSRYVNLSPEQKDAISHQFKPNTNISSLTSTSGGQFRDKWLNHINDYLKNKGYGQVNVTPHGFESPVDVAKLNQAQQMDLARSFAPTFAQTDPEFYNNHEAYLKNFADWQKRPIVNYGNAVRFGTKLLQDTPRAIGKGMMIGGGALGLYWLLKKLRHKKQMTENARDVLKLD